MIVSSSHGWLALFNKHNCDLFLSNPLSRRHIKLPPIHTLPIPEEDLRSGYERPMKKRNECPAENVIISSSSPDDDQDCRAMITYGPRNRLAFCRPNRSTEWTPLGDLTGYGSCAYSTRQKLLFCTTTRWPDADHFEAWDLRDPLSPRMIPVVVSVHKYNYPVASRSKEEHSLKYLSDHDGKFRVVAEPSDQLFHVRRFVTDWMGPHGYSVQDAYYGPKMGFDERAPYKTVGFDVHEYDPETRSLEYMDRSLGGLAFFIGCSNGFALSAAELPELKPDSIYYTAPPEWVDCIGGHDVGIFNHQDETFSPCFYPPHIQSIKRISAPKWFTPTPLVRFPLLVQNHDGTLSYASSSSSSSSNPATKLATSDERLQSKQ